MKKIEIALVIIFLTGPITHTLRDYFTAIDRKYYAGHHLDRVSANTTFLARHRTSLKSP